jgi:hypothetical protein
MRKMITIILTLMFSLKLIAPTSNYLVILRSEVSNPYQRLLSAIIQIESGGNPSAINPKEHAFGLLQIRPVMLKEVNRILREQKIIKSFTLTDALDSMKSIEMYWIIQNYYNASGDFKTACIVWNGKSKHNRYYGKVKAKLNTI